MSKKSFELVKTTSGRATLPKEYCKEIGLEPNQYVMAYVDKVKIPVNIALELGCKKDSEVKALIYVSITIQRRDLDFEK